MTSKTTINGLPGELWYKCYSYLAYDDVSRIRAVSKSFDTISRVCLNDGFRRSESLHSKWLLRVKGQLPRRESERRNHRLARVADILAAVETRLSLLSMTYKKHMDAGAICFIPGKVLDETFSVLRIVAHNINPQADDRSLKPHEILQELRDISSMAIEHFDDKIAPALREKSSSAFQGKAGLFMLNLGNIPFSGLRSMDSPLIRTVAAASVHMPSTSAMTQALAHVVAKNNASSGAAAVPTSSDLAASAAANNGGVNPSGVIHQAQVAAAKCDNLQRQHQGLQLVVTSHRTDIAQLRAGHKRHRERIFSQNRTILEQNHKISLLTKQLLEFETQLNGLKQEIRNIKNQTVDPSNTTDPTLFLSADRPIAAKRSRKQKDTPFPRVVEDRHLSAFLLESSSGRCESSNGGAGMSHSMGRAGLSHGMGQAAVGQQQQSTSSNDPTVGTTKNGIITRAMRQRKRSAPNQDSDPVHPEGVGSIPSGDTAAIDFESGGIKKKSKKL